MFFLMGINSGRKDLDFHQMIICSQCGAYGNLTVYMTYMYLSLFFIPCFKWAKKYYVQTTCCGTLYELDPELGKAIARGEHVEIRKADLIKVQDGYRSRYRRCGSCGYETQEDFAYCPKCGRKL